MKEKKQIKIRLRTLIYIIIIVSLCVTIGIIYYLGFIKDSKTIRQDTNNVKTAEESNTKKTENLVIYNGGEIKGISSQYPMVYEENIEKYSTTYNIYKDGQNIGKYHGTVEKDNMDEYHIIFDNLDNEYGVDVFGISADYEAFPRKHTETENIPASIKDKFPSTYELEKMEMIDLDGDGKIENLVVYKYSTEELGIMNNKTAYSGVVLFDSAYKQIAELASYKDHFYGGEEEACSITFSSGIEYIDIDNDGIMEIVVDVNSYVYPKVSIYKYHDGAVDGAVGLQFDPGA